MKHDKIFATAGLPIFFAAEYLLFTITTAFFLLRIPHWDLPVTLMLLPALLCYPLLYLLPALLLTAAVAAVTAPHLSTKISLRRHLIGMTCWSVSSISHLLLLLDAGIYFRYSYHINPHVLNIFTTPGGFEAMGLRQSEIISMSIGIAVILLLHGAILFFSRRLPFLSKITARLISWKYAAVTLTFSGLMFLITYTTYTFQHFSMNPQPLLAADAIPLYIKGTSRSLYKKLGFQPPERDAVRIKLSKSVSLKNYPQNKIIRNPDRPKYNLMWIACESWAAKLYSPEIMPKTAEFAEKAVLFTNHYSGGNVTRQGMFSMFYALPGNYWHPFFAARRGPLIIDWLNEDRYLIKCITSSRFTYPEFDQTIFFQVPQENMHSDINGKTWERDQRNLKLLIESIENGAKSGKPFFSFMFFESPHNPYEFPPEAKYTDDYIDPFVATRVTAADAPRIFNRAANCARHLDMCLDKVYRVLEEKDLMKNTIVVIAGDHGEEFYEHGFLGHSSSFVNEQIKTPLIIYYPGIKPGKYTGMSSHLDIIPMLARFFGVENDPADYSCGFDLLSNPGITRNHALIANWSQVFFAGEKYKSLIPTDAASFAGQIVTDSKDIPLTEVTPFYREYNRTLFEVQKDLTRFTSSKN